MNLFKFLKINKKKKYNLYELTKLKNTITSEIIEDKNQLEMLKVSRQADDQDEMKSLILMYQNTLDNKYQDLVEIKDQIARGNYKTSNNRNIYNLDSLKHKRENITSFMKYREKNHQKLFKSIGLYDSINRIDKQIANLKKKMTRINRNYSVNLSLNYNYA